MATLSWSTFRSKSLSWSDVRATTRRFWNGGCAARSARLIVRLSRVKLASISRRKIEVCLKEVYEFAADRFLVRPGNGNRNLSPLFKRQGDELQNRAEARFAVRRRQTNLAGIVSYMADNDIRGTKVNAMCVLNERAPLPHYLTLT